MVERIRNVSQTIGTDVEVVSEEQHKPNIRSVIQIVNTSLGGQKITISPADEAENGKGIVLSVGGFYQDSQESGYKPTQRRITAISDLADGEIAIHERVLSEGA